MLSLDFGTPMSSLPQKLLAALLTTSPDESLRNRLIRSTGGSFSLRIFSMGFKFLTSILLARVLTVQHYGAFSFALSWLLMLTLLAPLGFDRLLQREVAYFRVQENWGRLNGLWRWTWQTSLGMALFIIAGVFLIQYQRSTHLIPLPFLVPHQFQVFYTVDTLAQQTIMIALLALPFTVLIKLSLNTMQGLQRVVRGQIPEFVIQPLLFIGLVGGTYLILGRNINAIQVMSIHVAVVFFVAVYALWQVQRSFPQRSKLALPIIEGRKWLRQATPLFGLNLLLIVHSRADYILVGLLQDVGSVAFYNVAFTLAGLVSLVLTSAAASLSPTFATLHAQGDYVKLEKLVIRSARAIMLASLPIVAGLIVLGLPILRLYGPAYQTAYPALIVLVIGQFVNMSTGAVAQLLTMTGHERFTLIGQGISVVAYVMLLIVLIPPLGIMGAALATTAHKIIVNAIFVWYAWRKLGIMSTALGRLSRLSRP